MSTSRTIDHTNVGTGVQILGDRDTNYDRCGAAVLVARSEALRAEHSRSLHPAASQEGRGDITLWHDVDDIDHLR